MVRAAWMLRLVEEGKLALDTPINDYLKSWKLPDNKFTEKEKVTLRRIVAHFPSGELQFDAFSRFGVKLQWTNGVVRRAGATLKWAMDGPDDVLSAVPNLRLLSWVSALGTDGYDQLPTGLRIMAAVMRAIPGMRYMSQYHRYSWG